MIGAAVSVLDGNTVAVSDRAGNIEASLSDSQGLFMWDTRFLSRWILAVTALRLELLDIPGVWGRMDAFGRGRLDIQQVPAVGPATGDSGVKAMSRSGRPPRKRKPGQAGRHAVDASPIETRPKHHWPFA
jgi:N-terminal domain of (some) glycogen debranching enzymes